MTRVCSLNFLVSSSRFANVTTVVIEERLKLLLIHASAGGEPFTSAIRFRAVGEHAIFIRRYYLRYNYNARTSAAFSYIWEQ